MGFSWIYYWDLDGIKWICGDLYSLGCSRFMGIGAKLWFFFFLLGIWKEIVSGKTCGKLVWYSAFYPVLSCTDCCMGARLYSIHHPRGKGQGHLSPGNAIGVSQKNQVVSRHMPSGNLSHSY